MLPRVFKLTAGAALLAGLALAAPVEAASSIAVAPFDYSKRVRASANFTRTGPRGGTWVIKTRDNITIEFETHEFTNKLITSLVKENKFEVVERKKLDRLIDEQKLSASALVDPARAVEAGKLLGADYFVMAEISVYEAAARYQYFKPVDRYNRHFELKIVVDVRVVDTATGKIVYAEKEEASRKKVDKMLRSPAPVTISGSVMDAVQRELCQKIVRRLVNKVFPIKVIRFVNDQKVYLNRGSNGGVKVGQEYIAYEQGEELIDEDTGLNLGAEEAPVALLEVTSAREKFAIARVNQWFRSGQSSVPKGSICRPRSGPLPKPVAPPKPKDTTPPTVTIIAPTAGTITNQPAIPVDVECRDPDLAGVTINGRPADAVGRGRYQAIVRVQEGNNSIAVEAIDKAGNIGRAAGSFTGDRTAPAPQIAAPARGERLSRSPVAIKVRCDDGDVTRLIINGRPASRGSDGLFAASVDSPKSGNNRIAVEAYDRAGNCGRAQGGFIFDATPPSLRFLSPQPGSTLTARKVTIKVECRDPDLAGITINNQQARLLADGVYGLTCELSEGPNTIEAAARDQGGLEGRIRTAVRVDTIPPSLSFIRPARDRKTTNRSRVEVILASPDQDLKSVEINGRPAVSWSPAPARPGAPARYPQIRKALKSGKLRAPLYRLEIDLKAGSNTISAVAFDTAGNRGGARRELFCDTQPPTVTIISPPEGAYLKDASAKVLLECLDKDLAGISVGGAPAQALGGGRFAATVPLKEGRNSLNIQALDQSGLVSKLARSVTRDSQAPVVSFLTPKAGATLNTSPVNVWAKVSDANLRTVSINGQAAKNRGEGRYSVALKVKEGANTAVVTAVDAAGNVGRAELRFKFDSRPPDVSANLTVVVRGKVDDPASTVTVNGKPAKVQSDGSYELEVKLGKDRKVVIIATDPFGNARKVVRQY